MSKNLLILFAAAETARPVAYSVINQASVTLSPDLAWLSQRTPGP
jgi:hypothetical protein